MAQESKSPQHTTVALNCVVCGKQADTPLVLLAPQRIVHHLPCPHCGHDCGLTHPKDDVVVKINWWDIRTLVHLAELQAAQLSTHLHCLPVVVQAIAGRIAQQYPKMEQKMPLTFDGELRQIEELHPTFDINAMQNILPNKT